MQRLYWLVLYWMEHDSLNQQLTERTMTVTISDVCDAHTDVHLNGDACTYWKKWTNYIVTTNVWTELWTTWFKSAKWFMISTATKKDTKNIDLPHTHFGTTSTSTFLGELDEERVTIKRHLKWKAWLKEMLIYNFALNLKLFVWKFAALTQWHILIWPFYWFFFYHPVSCCSYIPFH